MRLALGLLCLAASVLLPLSALAVPWLGLSGPATAAVMTALTVGAPEICTVLAAMLLGREKLQYLLSLAWAALRRPFQPGPVPAWRYYLGLALILASALPGWVLAYYPQFLADAPRTRLLAAADLAFLAGFLVAGGEFWEKLRRLATWEGSVP